MQPSFSSRPNMGFTPRRRPHRVAPFRLTPTMAKSPATVGTDLGPKSEKTRARIMGATAELLNKNGYSGMRLSDIAEAADVQAPAI